ncbi:MAG: HEPN domain-containing protein [Nitrospirota bacterium]|nr:HEPN domain-containing protein [Nitrospirota bacterium]
MSIEFEECLKKQKIREFTRGSSLVEKELRTAEEDLKAGKKSMDDGNYKWSTIQFYYSMFHSARALLYAKNLREASHYCLIAAIKTLYVENNLLPVKLIEVLQTAKSLRESADYYDRWSRDGAEKLFKSAELFLEKTKEILKRG